MANGGRNNKYGQWLEQGNLLRVQGWAADGMSNKEIAAAVGVNPHTLTEWERRFPALSAAIKRGREQRSEAILARLHDVAMGYVEDSTEVVERTYRVVDGEKRLSSVTERTTRRRIPPSVPALIFEAKNRCGWADNPNQARAAEADEDVRSFIDGLGLK